MKSLIIPSLIASTFALASCAGSPPSSTSTSQNPAATEASADPNFGPKCIQRIKAGLTDPNSAEIDLSGEGDTLQAKVTTTNAGTGETINQTYVCKRDEDRAVIASLITD